MSLNMKASTERLGGMNELTAAGSPDGAVPVTSVSR